MADRFLPPIAVTKVNGVNTEGANITRISLIVDGDTQAIDLPFREAAYLRDLLTAWLQFQQAQ